MSTKLLIVLTVLCTSQLALAQQPSPKYWVPSSCIGILSGKPVTAQCDNALIVETGAITGHDTGSAKPCALNKIGNVGTATDPVPENCRGRILRWGSFCSSTPAFQMIDPSKQQEVLAKQVKGFAWGAGVSFEEGSCVPQDYTRAAYWYGKAAEISLRDPSEVLQEIAAHGRYDLARLYKSGFGVPQDYAKAASLYMELVNSEPHGVHTQFGELSKYELGYIYYYGFLGKPNYGAAYSLFKDFVQYAAYGIDHQQALTLLGIMCQHGWGVPVDPQQAVSWWQEAAKLGDARGIDRLADAYHDGYGGVQQDYSQAVTLYRQSADRGYSIAFLRLGYIYRDGEGVARDDVESYFWLSLAAASIPAKDQGDLPQDRDAEARKLTPSQIAQVRDRVNKRLHP